MILITHHTGESHGLLGVQVAATYLTKNLDLPSIVVGVERQFSTERLLDFIDDYYNGKKRAIGFSHLCGRKDLIAVIGAVRARGYFTILGGPQAKVDFYGEVGAETRPQRFKGLQNTIDLAIQGPVDALKQQDLDLKTGCLDFPWHPGIGFQVDWTNLYTFSDQLKKREVKTAQVLNAVGCPHAAGKNTVRLPLPEPLQPKSLDLEVDCYGCVFCDVARDKGYHGHVGNDALLSQIRNLPEASGRKIPFELIDEYPIVSLRRILDGAREAGAELSQIDLVCRVDDINSHRDLLREALAVAEEKSVTIMLSSIGFESFNDKILRYLNKGQEVDDILRCVKNLRELKERFGSTMRYRSDEGARHGFIHPTPWDDSETISENHRNIAMYRLFDDILPPHSVPLIIHHASYLGDWIREIESRLDLAFKRDGTWIEWWSQPVNFV
jgi:hypothetical protein